MDLELKQHRSSSFRIKDNRGDDGALNIHECNDAKFQKGLKGRPKQNNFMEPSLNEGFQVEDEEVIDDQDFYDCQEEVRDDEEEKEANEFQRPVSKSTPSTSLK